MLEAFATPALMASRSQGEVTAESHPYLARELAAATKRIRDYCGWHIAGREVVTYSANRRFADWVFLPAQQIGEVSSVTLDGVLLDNLALFTVDGATGETNAWSRVFSVVFEAGYLTVPADVEQITLELAAGSLGVGSGIVREQAGSVVVQYAGATLTRDMKDRLSAYRIEPLP